MKIGLNQNSYNKNYNASFKGVDVVKISKQAFPNFENLANVGNLFDDAVFKIPGTKDKVNSILEFPEFAMLTKYCKEKVLNE